MPTTAQGIFDLLAADTTLTALLGTYRGLPGVTGTVPALAVLMPMEERPPGITIQGVEVVVARFPSGGSAPFSTGGEEMSAEFRLHATQWTPSGSGAYNLEAVVRRIARLLPGASWRDNTPPEGLGGLAQMAITWLNPEVETNWTDI